MNITINKETSMLNVLKKLKDAYIKFRNDVLVPLDDKLNNIFCWTLLVGWLLFNLSALVAGCYFIFDLIYEVINAF